MNSTIELKGTRRVEWSDSCAIIAIESGIYSWRSAFCLRLLGITIPRAIFDDMLHGCIINQFEHIAFLDGYRALDEASPGHMSLWDTDASLIVDCAGGKDGCKQAKYE